MPNNSWKKERTYGVLVIVLAIITSLMTSLWALSFLVWSSIYIIWKWLEFYHLYHWYKKGAAVDLVPLNTGVFEDFCTLIVKNKNTSEKLVSKNKFLLNQFNIMAQALPYATILLNGKNEITWINHASDQILGVIQNKDENSKIENIIRDPTFTSLLSMAEDNSEINMNHPNDSNRKVHIRLVKLSNDQFLLVARDISEQESLRQSRKAFVDNASHELRTPLTVIVGYLEMLHTSGDIPKKWHAAIEQAMQQSTRMEKIIDDMLKLSSIEHERFLETNDDLIKMPLLLNRLLGDVKNSSKAKFHNFEANIDSDLYVIGNEEEIISIALNIMNNAVIHTALQTTISLRWFKENKQAHLWISDNGQGIEQKHLVHLTERFYRIDNSRDKNTNSTGLGLAIVKQICVNHGAQLDIISEPGSGTCFKVAFPASRIHIAKP
jgi:two-component system phosphate regulon sensor histidine kinase PhoR